MSTDNSVKITLENIHDYIGNYDCYLVFVFSHGWQHQNGYQFYQRLDQTLDRKYDATFTLVNTVKNGIICLECSHDNPTGCKTLICGLSEKEYAKLANADFGEIEKYALKKR